MRGFWTLLKNKTFQPARPLFTGEEVRKTFPGCQPNIYVTDYNHDGVPDLVIGLSLPTAELPDRPARKDHRKRTSRGRSRQKAGRNIHSAELSTNKTAFSELFPDN
jgi:hypothetical protein